MGRAEDLRAAIAKQEAAIGRLDKVRDGSKTAAQWRSLAINLRTVVRYQRELAALPVTVPVAGVPDSAYIIDSVDDTVYSPGGTAAGNPGGPDWTTRRAAEWYRHVWANNVGYHHVRPVLLPGSHVLTPAGYAYAVAFQERPGLTEAPADFNPLGLPLIP